MVLKSVKILVENRTYSNWVALGRLNKENIYKDMGRVQGSQQGMME